MDRETILVDLGEPIAYRQYAPREVAQRGMVFSFGGMFGELILTFNALLDFILANPSNAGFQFTYEQFEVFLC